jgi:hypothetical protein
VTGAEHERVRGHEPDRDLLHADASVRATDGLRPPLHRQAENPYNVVGRYSAVGVGQVTADERKKDLDLLVGELEGLALRGRAGVVICVEPLNRFETSFSTDLAGDRGRRPWIISRGGLDTFHEHRGE